MGGGRMFGTTMVSHISIISSSLSAAAALSIYRKPNFYYHFLHLIQQANKFPEIWNHTPLEHLVDIARILSRCWSHLICCCWSRFSGERYARETQMLKKKEDSFTIHNLKWKKEIEWKSKHFYYKLRDPLSWTWWSLHFLSLSHTQTHTQERERGKRRRRRRKERKGTEWDNGWYVGACQVLIKVSIQEEEEGH